MKRLLPALFSIIFLFAAASAASAATVPAGAKIQSLNGYWKLAVVLPGGDEQAFDDFFAPGFSEKGMRPVRVPSNWDMEGFETARYADPGDAVGFYRRKFSAPKLAPGERLFIRFEGVLFGADVWLNGTKLGKHLGGFTPFEFDITDKIMQGAENILAVKVTKQRAKGYEFDTNDSWALSGIHRDVFMFKTPAVRIDSIRVVTDLDDEYKNAELKVSASIVNASAAGKDVKVRAELYAPKTGKKVAEMSAAGPATTDAPADLAMSARIKEPKKWNAESPVLYKLRVTLETAGAAPVSAVLNVGFREVKADGVRLLINGVPVKLRGVNRHELAIERGSALTTADWLADLKLMKKANVNTIRTSHYPPDEEFIDLCDRLGFYVIDEVPFGFGDFHLNDPSYHDLLKARARETIERDINHPSVIIWSLGNENRWSIAHPKLLALAHKLDPTRPLLLPRTGFETGEDVDLEPEVDILAPHYPEPDRLDRIASRQESMKNGRPVIMTEYLHSLGRQIVTRQMWDTVWKHESSAGGCVWMWNDQGIKRSIDGQPVFTIADQWPFGKRREEKKEDSAVLFLDKRLDENHIVDSRGIYCSDGIVGADLSPQPEFYEVRKIYSPVHIVDEALLFNPGTPIFFRLQNRYDFTDLRGMKFKWALFEDFKSVAKGDGAYAPLAPHMFGMQPAVPKMPKPRAGAEYLLKISSYDRGSMNIDTHWIRLKPETPAAVPAKAAACAAPSVREDRGLYIIGNNKFSATFDSRKGTIVSVVSGGKPIPLKGPELDAWRPLQLVETSQPATSDLAALDRFRNLKPDLESFEEPAAEGTSVSLRTRVFYRMPDSRTNGFKVTYTYNVSCSGEVRVDYKIEDRVQLAALLELGVKFTVPKSFRSVSVKGNGPDTYAQSIQNTETSYRWVFTDTPAKSRFYTNKTAVDSVVVKGRGASLAFAYPADADPAGGRNFRASLDADGIGLHFCPWVKHPYRKYNDPPGYAAVQAAYGNRHSGSVILKLGK